MTQWIYNSGGAKLQLKNDGWSHHKGDKKGRPEKGQKMNNL
jgi:hypothetical protein